MQSCSLDSGFFELLIRPSRFDRFVLPLVTYQQHSVMPVHCLEKLIHLFRANCSQVRPWGAETELIKYFDLSQLGKTAGWENARLACAQ